MHITAAISSSPILIFLAVSPSRASPSTSPSPCIWATASPRTEGGWHSGTTPGPAPTAPADPPGKSQNHHQASAASRCGLSGEGHDLHVFSDRQETVGYVSHNKLEKMIILTRKVILTVHVTFADMDLDGFLHIRKAGRAF
ncbi:hypothetical protein ZEAMMB73_Zm00001d012778 [Zea mays]|uniref:Uncharacterized protein n=1 Tax=Zea mays TaxID=4577 RepID=A0A1D6GCE2_MAIZE|nr:hypothetical protein ZEAMMB73_Zm00001d012778 [Zea mays]